MLVINLCLRYGYTHGECGAYGDNLVWEFDDGVLTISGEGEMRDYSSHNDLRKIQIPEGVSTIEVETFQRCSRLKEIKFPESLNEIQENAFVFQWSNCDGILSGME